MTALLLIITLLYIGGLGYWVMKKVDTFIKSGYVHSAWDSKGEKTKKAKEQRSLHCSLKES
jgi:hypothetical protein